MALDAATAQEMIKKLADDQAQYLNTLNRAHEILAQALTAAATGRSGPRLTSEGIRQVTTNRNAAKVEVESVKRDSKGSILSEEDDEPSTEDNESLFASEHLPTRQHDEEAFRKHLKDHAWTDAGKAIIHDLLENMHITSMRRIFITAPKELKDRSELSHYSIFDVGQDGAPLPIIPDRTSDTRAAQIWDRIQHINANPRRQRKAVGRITIVREPSPLLFAALHYTQKDHFDVDELFRLLVDRKTEALPHRPFSPNPVHRRTFVWTMEYFTIIGDACVPMKWQLADRDLNEKDQHIPISRCSSVIALSLDSEPMGQIRNKSRRANRKYGDVHDPFSPWHVLSMQAYPDWKSSIDSHDSTKHYVNGPEAFLVTLRAEFKDAQKRLLEVYKRISELVTTPADFMFRQDVRDKLLFEDDEFTYSRRYFWAYQSLCIMNEDIQEMVNAYKTTFTEDVWNGSDKIIWPGDETTSSRYAHWRKRMAAIREDIEHEVTGLEEIEEKNQEKMKEVKTLRENLFSGTSVLESRRSVQQQAITVQQGHNIKLLTLVTIFFLPLTFVTSVFSMTNIKYESFVPFGITTLVICLPTYMLIGSLNTTSGLQFWSHRTRTFFNRIGHLLTILRFSKPSQSAATPSGPTLPTTKPRSQSASEGIAARQSLGPNNILTPDDGDGTATLTMSPAVTTERTVTFGPPTRTLGGGEPKSPSAVAYPHHHHHHRTIDGNGSEDNTRGLLHGGGGWFARMWGGRRRWSKPAPAPAPAHQDV